jgi:flagellar hook-basal body complex protein FliE
MIAMEKADVAFKLIMQIRSKVISAYETIMRTQV